MSNADVIRAFERIADLLEIDGADRFRVNSYKKAARTIKECPDSLETISEAGRLTDLPGVGKGTASRIKQFLETGHIDVLDELQAKFPPGLPRLLDIQGMGPKKVALAYRELNVGSIDDLKRVIESGELAKLPGLGETSVKKIGEGIAFMEKSGGRTAMGRALPVAAIFSKLIAKLPGVKQVEVAGSLRRGKETVGDVDLLCEAADGGAVIEAFTKFDGVVRVLAKGNTKGSVTVDLGDGRELQVDLRVVDGESFGAALQYFSGSKEHNVRLRERAVAKKWRLNEYGLYDGETQIAGETEEGIYKKLGLPWIPPELREDRGELELGDDMPELVAMEDIRGDLHMHTTASDGKCSIAEMATTAKKRGYKYIAICDHSKSSTIANGLSIDRMEKQINDVRTANEEIDGIEVLVGTECDILASGEMDYPNEILARCDWVVASIHSGMGESKSQKLDATERTIAAMENRYVCAIGHPTGRLINRRPPMALDIQQIVEAAARTKTLLEVNASWQRLDLKDLHIMQALAAGVMITINTDAHHFDQFAQMPFGVTTARRARATKKDVVNCLTLAGLRKRIAEKRDA
jgi:DNA polymerase (family X)